MKTHESLAFGVGLMARLFDRELRIALFSLGVLPGQVPVLLVLYEADGVTQAQLARLAGVEQPTMAATLARMERGGLVMRAPDPDDGRRALIHLTDRGRELERPLIDAVRGVNRRAVHGLSADERSVLYRVVEQTSQNLGVR
jgi:DNA-binding MarR family transcriptional regulator